MTSNAVYKKDSCKHILSVLLYQDDDLEILEMYTVLVVSGKLNICNTFFFFFFCDLMAEIKDLGLHWHIKCIPY